MACAPGLGRAPAMMFGPGEAQELRLSRVISEEEEQCFDSMPSSPLYAGNSLWSPTSFLSAVAANPVVSPLVSPLRRSDQIVLPSEQLRRLAGEGRATDTTFGFRSRSELEYSLADAERQVQKLGVENACLRQRLRTTASKPESVETFLEELSRQRQSNSQSLRRGAEAASPAQDFSLKLDRKFEEFCNRSRASSSVCSPRKVTGFDTGYTFAQGPPEKNRPTEDASSSTSRFCRTAGQSHDAEVTPWKTPPARLRGAGNDLSGQALVEGPGASAGRDSSLLGLSPDSDCVCPSPRIENAAGLRGEEPDQHNSPPSPPQRRASGCGTTHHDNLQQRGSADRQAHDCRAPASNMRTEEEQLRQSGSSTSVPGPQALDIEEASVLPAVFILNESPPASHTACNGSQETLQQQENCQTTSPPPRRQILVFSQTWPLKRSSSSPAVANVGLLAGARQRHRSSSPPSCLQAAQRPLLWLPVSPAF